MVNAEMSRLQAEIRNLWSNIEGIRLQPLVDLQLNKEVGREVLAQLSPGLNAEDYFSEVSTEAILLQFFDQIDCIGQMNLTGITFLNLPVRVLADSECIWRLKQLRICYRKGLAIELQDPVNLITSGDQMIRHVERGLRILRDSGWPVWLDDLTSDIFEPLIKKEIQFDGIKIDRAEMVAGRDNVVKFRRFIAKARHLTTPKGYVLTEGIETESDLSIARESGADWGQGFLWQEQLVNWSSGVCYTGFRTKGQIDNSLRLLANSPRNKEGYTTRDVAVLIGCSIYQARNLLLELQREGWVSLKPRVNPTRGSRLYWVFA